MQIHDHCLVGCRQVKSPNFNERPQWSNVSLLVVHGISLPPGEYGGPYIDQLFCNSLSADEHPYFKDLCKLKVSSHLLIRRDGELVQYVPFDKRAWHAGRSSYAERENCNDFSIGIELEGVDHVAYEKIQYQKLAELSALLINVYPEITAAQPSNINAPKASTAKTYMPISDANIVGHSDIAPGRKTDPGSSFDWRYFQSLLFG